MNYGQSQAIKVLVKEKMGFSTATLEMSKNLLSGTRVHPMNFRSVEEEAVEFHNKLISHPHLQTQANKIGEEIINEFGVN